MSHTQSDNEGIVAHIKEWVELRIISAKLAAVEGVSVVLGNILGLVIALILGSFGLIFLAWVFTIELGKWIGSEAWAIVIMGGVLLLLAAVAWLCREKIFGNMMVGMLSKLVFKAPVDDEQ